MKSFIFIVLFIGSSFVDANVLDTLEGVLTLLPCLKHAAKGFDAMANSKKSFSKALNNTSNCGKSGSNTALLTVGQSTSDLAKALASLADNLSNQTSDKSGQLKLLSGDLTKIVDQIEISANKLEALAGNIDTLTENVDTESLEGLDKILPDYEELLKASEAFNGAFENVAEPSSLLLKLVSVSLLTGFTDSVHNLAEAYVIEKASIESAQSRCGISTGLVQPMGDLAEICDTIVKNLLILGLLH